MTGKTMILETDENNVDPEVINRAADVIRKGGIVVFPTETVYGLGADIFNTKAVKKIFDAKGRPSDNPLIVHISDTKMTDDIVTDIPVHFSVLAEKFWPGPLTMIMRKRRLIPAIVTAGLDTVAVRLPSNKIARSLIRAANTPICAPSANISGRPSATSFEDAYDDFYGKVDAIIKSGNSQIGLESTVIDLSGGAPEILRPGSVTREELSELLGFDVRSRTDADKETTPRSPGMKYRHYSPKAELLLFAGEEGQVRKHIISEAKRLSEKHKVGIISFKPWKGYEEFPGICLSIDGSLEEASRKMFASLRFFDKENVDFILSETIPETGLGAAIMNRLLKAGDHKITYL